MDFINKLIKRGIFGLILVFSFFVFSNGMKVNASSNCVKLNDGNEYLVVNKSLGWTDSGVEVTCSGVSSTDVMVQINNGPQIATTDNGKSATSGFSFNVGYYKIKYYVVDASN